jgi:DNA-binding XRE family transcriptional regulator
MLVVSYRSFADAWTQLRAPWTSFAFKCLMISASTRPFNIVIVLDSMHLKTCSTRGKRFTDAYIWGVPKKYGNECKAERHVQHERMTDQGDGGYDHQDWSTVTLKHKGGFVLSDPSAPPSDADGSSRSHGGGATSSTTTSMPAWKVEQLVDDPSHVGKALPVVPREVAQQIIAGRTRMKLTQKQLACKLNMQPKDIQEMENGKGIENKIVLAKVKRFLGLGKVP